VRLGEERRGGVGEMIGTMRRAGRRPEIIVCKKVISASGPLREGSIR
jgi:hypothetical protein